MASTDVRMKGNMLQVAAVTSKPSNLTFTSSQFETDPSSSLSDAASIRTVLPEPTFAISPLMKKNAGGFATNFPRLD